jgi:molybdopterin-guanine dinucleotide biosynthesis protein B
LFDRVVIVDWSAANAPSPARPGKDAIWIGLATAAGVTTSYHRTRHAAETVLRGLIAAGGRVLIGCDFPFGYPAGFAARLTRQADARAIWHWLAGRIIDDARNANNRFAVAAEINRSFGGAGPFWGRPAHLVLDGLPQRKAVDYAALGLAERRQIERQVPRAQPVWKLYTTGSVGSQTLMGVPMLHRLATAQGLAVWPFDAPAAMTLAEVYPSLLARAVARDPGPIKDEVQVRLLARALYALAQAGRLGPLFETPAIAREEGWILGAGHGDLLQEALTWA